MKLETRKYKKGNVAPLGAQKNGENGLGQKAEFASVQRFAERRTCAWHAAFRREE
jgi:hypothetical protein